VISVGRKSGLEIQAGLTHGLYHLALAVENRNLAELRRGYGNDDPLPVAADIGQPGIDRDCIGRAEQQLRFPEFERGRGADPTAIKLRSAARK